MSNVLEELSPYCFQGLGRPSKPGWWTWGTVIEILRRYERIGIPQPELPRSIQRPGSVVGLAVGLAVRQAALSAGWTGGEELARAS